MTTHPSSRLIVDLYRRHAQDWIQRRGPGASLERGWLDQFSALLPDAPAILDLGCGSGQPIADDLISRGAIVTGVDASGPLLDFARARHGPPHQWIEADMRGLDLGRTFDGLIAWHSFFHLSPEDQRGMFTVFARHLQAGGALMFTSGSQHEEAIGAWQGEPLYHGSLSAEEYRERLDAAGFEVVASMLDDPSCGNSTVWLARKTADPQA